MWLWIAPLAAQAHRAEHDTRQSHPNQITVKMQESSCRWRSMGDKSLTPKLFLPQPYLFKIMPTFPIKNKQTKKISIALLLTPLLYSSPPTNPCLDRGLLFTGKLMKQYPNCYDILLCKNIGFQ